MNQTTHMHFHIEFHGEEQSGILGQEDVSTFVLGPHRMGGWGGAARGLPGTVCSPIHNKRLKLSSQNFFKYWQNHKRTPALDHPDAATL